MIKSCLSRVPSLRSQRHQACLTSSYQNLSSSHPFQASLQYTPVQVLDNTTYLRWGVAIISGLDLQELLSLASSHHLNAHGSKVPQATCTCTCRTRSYGNSHSACNSKGWIESRLVSEHIGILGSTHSSPNFHRQRCKGIFLGSRRSCTVVFGSLTAYARSCTCSSRESVSYW